MAESYYSILTNIGKAQIANAIGLGNKIDFVKMKVGDGNGSYYNPTESQTDLVHTVWEGAIGHVAVDENNPNWINIEVLIPPDAGGFFIREYGVFDANDNMLAVAKCAETYKPLPADGSTKEINMKMIIAVSNTSSITLKIDPTILFAKKKDVDEVSTRVDQLSVSINNINTQLSDRVYQAAGGSAAAITLTIKGTLVTGYPITFIASANNGGAATTINGKKLYKPGTTTSPNLIAGKAYTVWYNSISDCFFIKASAEGSALAKDVRKNTTFSNDNDTGILGGLDLSLLVSGNLRAGVTIDGVTGKSSVVDTADALATAAQLLSGTSAYVNGTKLVGNMPNHTGADSPANSIAGTGPSRIYVRPQYGYYDGSVASYVDDANFIAANIIAGKSIFGLTGTASIVSLGGLRIASGTIPMASVSYANGNNIINLSGYVNFTPKIIHGNSPYYGFVDPGWIYVINSPNSYTYICYASGGVLKRTDVSAAFSLSSIIIETANNSPLRDVVWTAIG
ncbi:MAG: phage tail protein [Clostridium beijerinckii]|jgi:phage-related tail fiber protein|nr:phage tail protein [Clostridium beijerinckii]MCI1578571.1 phage tail protein [Clostridium beijerinckii]MCI1582097.1 phage tail protein [Clostridium beijerinckii]MCI1621947.1 phage tail protein [Clostridium beijerinckii]